MGKATDNSRANAYHLARHVIEHGDVNGIAPHDCGEYQSEAEALVAAGRQSGKGGAARALDELDGLRRLVNQYDPERDAARPLADLNVFTAAELLDMELPPLRYVVEGVLPEGTSLLVAPPKIGKSLLCLNVAFAVANGSKALGKADVLPGRVLYLDLDGNRRGMQRRLRCLLKGTPRAEAQAALERLDIAREFPRLEPGEGEASEDARARMREYLEAHDDVRLVIVDTLANVKPKTSGRRNMYDTDREALTPFRSMFEEFGVSSIFVHHTNKSTSSDPLDTVSGSTGLTSAVDNVLVMRKERGQHDAELQVIPREEEETTLALAFDTRLSTWCVKGDVRDFAKTDERQVILRAVRNFEADGLTDGVGPKEVAEATGKSYDSVRALMPRMVDNGSLRKIGFGKYATVHTPRSHRSHRSHSSHPSHRSQKDAPPEEAPF